MEGRIRGLHQTDSCLRITHEPNTIAEWPELGVTRLQHLVHEYERGTFSDVQGSKAIGPDFNVVTSFWISRVRGPLVQISANTQICSKTCVINRVVPERRKFLNFQGSKATGPDFSEKR